MSATPPFPRHLLMMGGVARCGETHPTHVTRVPAEVQCPRCIEQFTPDEAHHVLNRELIKAFDTLAAHTSAVPALINAVELIEPGRIATAHTPAEARTGTPDTMAAIGAEVAWLRENVHVDGPRYPLEDHLRRIEAWAPERARDEFGEIWQHSCGMTGYGPGGACPGNCGESDGTWRALYVQAGR